MYCQEPGPVCKQTWSLLNIKSTCLLRVFLFSIMFKHSPLISCLILLLIYSVAALLYRWFGDGLQSMSQAYFTLYLPCGHTHLQGGKPGYIPSSSGFVNYHFHPYFFIYLFILFISSRRGCLVFFEANKFEPVKSKTCCNIFVNIKSSRFYFLT